MEKMITDLDSAITALTTKRPHRHHIAAPKQLTQANRRAAGPRLPSPPPTLTPSLCSPSTPRAIPPLTARGDVKREIALKATLKKKCRGNEEIIWNEMRVLQVLDHANIVRSFLPPFFSPPCARCLTPNIFGCLSVGQILRMIRVGQRQPRCRP